MNRINLKDFQKWKDLNQDKRFSFFDYIFQKITKENLSSDIFFSFLELFWPSMICYKEYILLAANFSESITSDLIHQNQNVEFWANLLMVDPYFENDEDREERGEFLAKSLIPIWKTKLRKEFPDKEFIVEYVSDPEQGDYGITFYQSMYKKNEINNSES